MYHKGAETSFVLRPLTSGARLIMTIDMEIQDIQQIVQRLQEMCLTAVTSPIDMDELDLATVKSPTDIEELDVESP